MNAIADMTPEARALIGVSYDPDCVKSLGAPVAPQIFKRFQTIPVPGLNTGETKAVQYQFDSPVGFRFSRLVATAAQPSERSVGKLEVQGSPQSTITGRGRTIDFAVRTKNVSDASSDVSPEIEGQIEALLTPDHPPVRVVDAPEPQVRSFPISRTLDAHSVTVTRRNYTDHIAAPPGFRFQEVVGISTASLNHSPSNGARAAIVSDGTALDVSYSLESGPIYDQWRGWIDAFVIAKLKPSNR
jgi:serine protease Do